MYFPDVKQLNKNNNIIFTFRMGARAGGTVTKIGISGDEATKIGSPGDGATEIGSPGDEATKIGSPGDGATKIGSPGDGATKKVEIQEVGYLPQNDNNF